MAILKVKSHLTFSKEHLLDLVLINYLLKLNYTGFCRSSNHFVSLKSPFHYKLGKNHLNIKSIEVLYYAAQFGFSVPDTSVLGLAHSLHFFKKTNYSL